MFQVCCSETEGLDHLTVTISVALGWAAQGQTEVGAEEHRRLGCQGCGGKAVVFGQAWASQRKPPNSYLSVFQAKREEMVKER